MNLLDQMIFKASKIFKFVSKFDHKKLIIPIDHIHTESPIASPAPSVF